jgi:hypothetical protein
MLEDELFKRVWITWREIVPLKVIKNDEPR